MRHSPNCTSHNAEFILLQAGPVRDAAADSLLALYKKSSNLSLMHEFTERFKPRFLELPNDIDENVAVKGVSICFHNHLLYLGIARFLVLREISVI